MPRRRWSALGAWALVLCCGQVQAEPAPESGQAPGRTTTACFDWNAGKGCPGVREAERAVEDVLGRPLFQGPTCDLRVRASVERAADRGWQAELGFTRQDGTSLGTRTLQSQAPSCQALLNPMSLVVALVVEDAEAQVTLKVPVEPAGQGARPGRSRIFAEVTADHGLLPNTGVGNSLGVDHRLPAWLSSRLSTTFWLPQSSESQGRGGQFWAWQMGLAVCPSLGPAEGWRGGLCLGAHTGILRGTGLGLDDTQAATRMVGGADLRTLFSYPVARWLALTAHAGAALPWLRPRFVYYDSSGALAEIHRPRAIQVQAGLGVELAVFSSHGDAP